MSNTLWSMKAPSAALLRSLLKPSQCGSCQVREASNYVPRHKYAKITALDKLHRKQKADLRQERLNSLLRAKAMQPPQYLSGHSATSSPTPASKPNSSASTTTSETLPDSIATPTPTTTASNAQPIKLPYTIYRTASNLLPVYEHAKGGGTKHLTQIRKLDGDLATLQSHIRSALGIEQHYIDKQGRKKENITINWRTRHVIVRGWRGAEVKRWAEMSGF